MLVILHSMLQYAQILVMMASEGPLHACIVKAGQGLTIWHTSPAPSTALHTQSQLVC